MASVSLEKILKQVKALSAKEQYELRALLDGLLREAPSKSKEEELERKLQEIGLLKRIPPPITDLTPYRNRTPVEAKGKLASEIIVEERR